MIPALLLDVAVSSGVFFLAAYLSWGTPFVWREPLAWPGAAVLWLIVACGRVLVRLYGSGWQSLRFNLLWLVAIYTAAMAYVLLSRAYYSWTFLVASFVGLAAWYVVEQLAVGNGRHQSRLAVVPSPFADKLKVLPELSLVMLTRPELSEPVDGLVVDMHVPLDERWTRFIAECAAGGLPVYHMAAVYETASARLPLAYLSDGRFRELAVVPTAYLPVKRVLDLVFILLSLPVVLPLMAVTALAIRLESPGPVLFWQERVGQGGKTFWLVKFRSMRSGAEDNVARTTDEDDARITRVGRIIRRFRVDELPQLWNVLKGEMSLIGPRPEQVALVREFEKAIPFYQWRHRVKPGLTGWAQVNQGYASGVEDTMEKLEYDLYYVKHLSLWLDLAILLETVRTVLTGRGAR